MLEWITGAIEGSGYTGVFLLMLLENIFPPIPSELVMPLSGFAAKRGELNIFLVVAAGSLGSVAGALFWYGMGAWLGTARLKRWAGRHGHWLTMRPKEVDKACGWFDRHGGRAVFLGRLVPAVRTLISVPAGVVGMKASRFLLLSLLGTVLWTGLLAFAGYQLGDDYRRVEKWMSPLSTVVVVVLLAGYVYRVVTFRRAARAAG